MSWKRSMLRNVIVKMPEVAAITLTASGGGSTITSLGTAFATGITKPYDAVKIVFPFIKTGGATAVAVQLELQSDTGTGSAYQSLGMISAFSMPPTAGNTPVTITPVGTDNAHGYVATTGAGLVEASYDLNQVMVGTNLKIKISATFVAASTDTVVGTPLLIFGDARQEPPSSTLVSTVA